MQDFRAEERGTFLQQLESAGKKNVLVMAATNHLENMDPAVVRPGRFDYKIKLSLPDKEMRRHLIGQFFKDIPIKPDLDLNCWSQKFEGKSVAEIKGYCEEARRIAFRQTLQAKEANKQAALVAIDETILEKVFTLAPSP